jgi:hypothetical protein
MSIALVGAREISEQKEGQPNPLGCPSQRAVLLELVISWPSQQVVTNSFHLINAGKVLPWYGNVTWIG